MNKTKAAFFDRDGTLIEDMNYLSDLDQIKILPGIIELCLFLQKIGYKLFVVTNQSGVARGFFDENFVIKTHEYLKNFFMEKNVFFEKFYYCPHHPEKAIANKYLKVCYCRKPNPGMLYSAAKEFDLDLSQSLIFGDKEKDIKAGEAVGCKSFYIQNVLEQFVSDASLKSMFNV